MTETHRVARRAVCAVVLGGLLAGASLFAAAAAVEPEWPCAQRYVPEISAGAIWTGPPLDEALESWEDNEAVRNLVNRLVEYDMEVEQGVQEIDGFAATLGADKDAVLTQLFAGLLERINRMRARMLKGIKRFYRRQQKVVDRITEIEAEIRKLDEKGVGPEDEKRKDLDEELLWNVRVFDEREKLTPYICEEPVLLEQKLGAFARAILAHMGKDS